jgi:hypothetical protein
MVYQRVVRGVALCVQVVPDGFKRFDSDEGLIEKLEGMPNYTQYQFFGVVFSL